MPAKPQTTPPFSIIDLHVMLLDLTNPRCVFQTSVAFAIQAHPWVSGADALRIGFSSAEGDEPPLRLLGSKAIPSENFGDIQSFLVFPMSKLPFFEWFQNEARALGSPRPNWLREAGELLMAECRSQALVSEHALFDTFDPTGVSQNPQLKPLAHMPAFMARLCALEEARALGGAVNSAAVPPAGARRPPRSL